MHMISPFFALPGGGALHGVPWWAVMIPFVIVILLGWFISRDNE
jgi:hypothetical protein